MPHPKNVIIFNTDQQRADSLGCMGNSRARTRAIDALAARGTVYTRHYAANPVCMPSRASFITGRTVLAHRVLTNGIFLAPDELTMPEVFRRNGYRTASIGKLHFQTYQPFAGDNSMESAERWQRGELDDWRGPYYGFEDVQLTCGHGEGSGGHYGRWRKKNFPGLQLGAEFAPGKKFPLFQSFKSTMPLAAYSSTWVADRALEFLDGINGNAPFYLNVSFRDPHHSFTPPAPYNTMFDDIEFPPPHAVPGENETKPEPYRAAMRSKPNHADGGPQHYPDFAGEAYQQVVAHTYGMIALIDDCIGRVMQKLAAIGQAGNTVIVFTSDHGEFLGDHHFLFKALTPCRSLLNVPLIISDPDGAIGRCDAVGGNIDVMPTVLAACGLEIPATVQGVVLPAPGEAPRRDHAFESAWSTSNKDHHHFSIYKQDWRISYFPHLGDGEMYNLDDDPHEHRNLFHHAEHRDIRTRLMEELLQAVGRAEPTMPAVVASW